MAVPSMSMTSAVVLTAPEQPRSPKPPRRCADSAPATRRPSAAAVAGAPFRTLPLESHRAIGLPSLLRVRPPSHERGRARPSDRERATDRVTIALATIAPPDYH